VATCRTEDGGNPRCKLGFLTRKDSSERLNRTIEIKGRTAAEIKAGGRSQVKKFEDYNKCNLFVVVPSPDWEDDFAGFPMAGSMGEKFIYMLEKAKVNLDDVYITYSVKCRSPKGRKPTREEYNDCSIHLTDELKMIDPKLVVLLGSETLKLFSLNNLGGISAIHGQIFEKPYYYDQTITYKVMCSFHPSQIILSGNPALERACIQDLMYLNGSQTKKTYKTNYKLVTDHISFEEMIKELSAQQFFTVDTESAGLNCRKEPLLCLSFSAGKNKNWVLPILANNPESVFFYKGKSFPLTPIWDETYFESELKPELQNLFNNTGISKGGWNIKYDLQVLKYHLGIETEGFLFDAMLMKHLLNELPPNDLKACSDVELRTGDYSASIRDVVGQTKNLISSYAEISNQELWDYTAIDTESTYLLKEIYHKQLLEKPNLWKLYCNLTEPTIRTLFEAEYYGHLIDLNIVNKLSDEYTKELKTLQESFNKIVPPIFNVETSKVITFNPMSPENVGKALIDLGYKKEIEDKYSSTGISTSKDILLFLSVEKDLQFAADILTYRNRNKLLTTYLSSLKEDVDENSYVHYSWNPLTVTGRLQCRTMHQIPRTEKKRIDQNLPVLRDIFIAPDGYDMIYFDMSQIELRVLAVLSNEIKMLNMFKENKDIHKHTAAILLDIPEEEVSEYNRQAGKAVNFSIVFGSKGYQILEKGDWEDKKGNKRPFTESMFNRGFNNLRNEYSNMFNYIELIPDLARMNGGTVTTPFGRERHLGTMLNSGNKSKRKAAEREAVNSIVQSTAGEITIRILNKIHIILKVLEKTKQISSGDIRLVNTVHDSGAYICKEKFTNKFNALLKKRIESPIPRLNNYSFPCKIGIGKTWTESELNAK